MAEFLAHHPPIKDESALVAYSALELNIDGQEYLGEWTIKFIVLSIWGDTQPTRAAKDGTIAFGEAW